MIAVIVSGKLKGLSDNFPRFLDSLKEPVHCFVHTWDTVENNRWVTKLNRYSDLVNIEYLTESPIEDRKFAILYSTYQAVSLIPDLNKYSTIIKFKPDLDTDNIIYDKNITRYYQEAVLHTYPLLKGKKKEDFIYGRILYKTLDERMFTAFPKAIETLFKRPYEEYITDLYGIDAFLIKKYGMYYEGSILWTNYIKERGLDLIQDLTLQLPNCKVTNN